MLIGNRGRFAVELVPVTPSWETRYEPEAAAWAGLSIWVEGKNLCAHVRNGEETLRGALFVPLGPIADWIVKAFPGIAFEERPFWMPGRMRLHEIVRKWGESPPPVGFDEDTWLDLREQFWSRHFLLAGADGAVLPNVALLREDDDVVVSWASRQARSAPSMTFVNAEGKAVVAWPDVRAVLERLVAEVRESFERKNVAPYAWMRAPGHRLGAAPLDAIALFCARPVADVAALLGVAPGEVTDRLGPDAADDPAANALCQVFRDLPPCPTAGIGDEARATLEASAAGAAASARDAWTDARALAFDAARAAKTPEDAGQLAAHALRDSLGIDGEPIASTSDLLARVGLATREPEIGETEHEHMLIAADKASIPVVTVLSTNQTRTPWGRRFEEARALGHALLDPLRRGALGAASTRWAQDIRRRRSGAFAAELLLPESAMRKASGDHVDAICAKGAFESLLAAYGVGAQTAGWQLYNKRLLSAPARDELFAKHAKDHD